MKLASLLNVSLLALSALALSACEGDARDLTEPVEASRLNLASLRIVPPAGSNSPLTVNPDELISFSLEARNTANQVIDIASTNRRWSVSDASIATINQDGFFTGLLEDEVDIYVSIGDVLAPPLTVEVSFGVLSEIGEIEGAPQLQQCIAQTYSADGIFTDNSSRNLDTVSWSLEPTESGSISVDEESGAVTLTGTTPGAITLTATSDGISGSRVLNIDSSLESIALTDGLSLAANGALQLVAQGSYMGQVEAVDISSAVAWSITQGTDQADVSNTGLLSGKAEGSVVVQAACGADTSASATLTITPEITQLVAEDGTDVDLNVGEIVQLQIATGAIYDEDNDVTRFATWDIVGLDESVASVSNASGSKGRITGLTRGEVTVRAIYQNESIDFIIDVN